MISRFVIPIVLIISTVTIIQAHTHAKQTPPSRSHSHSHAHSHSHSKHVKYMDTIPKRWFSACVVNPTTIPPISFETSSNHRHHRNNHRDHDHDDADRGNSSQPIVDASFNIVAGRDPTCAAQGWFADTINQTGWAYLAIHTNGAADDYLQSRAAGYLEGFLTYYRIYQESLNAYNNQFNTSTPDPRVTTFINANIAWIRAEVAKKENIDPFWHQAGLILYQIQGMVDGYNAAQPNQNLTFAMMDMLLINLNGDLTDIMPSVNISLRVDFKTMSPAAILRKLIQRGGHCSALIKWTGAELYTAHNTWANYCSMLRVFKLYEIPLHEVVTSTIHFSSYFGMVDSNDDFYALGESHMAVIETTNDIANDTLYNYVTPESIMTWMRVTIANRLSSNGKEWTTNFARYNSGTYNNQWMVVDYKLFTPSTTIQDNTLWVLSQIPGHIRSADVSHILRTQSYWASFNRPYFTDLFIMAGFADLEKQYGSYLFGYKGYFREQLFAREQAHVHEIADMKRVMQLNKWKTDPLAKNSSGFAISSRYDLAHYDPAPATMDFYVGAWGGIDTKITSYEWMMDGTLGVEAISGPTHQDNPPFAWIPRWTDTHLGHPYMFNFSWVQFGTHIDIDKQKHGIPLP